MKVKKIKKVKAKFTTKELDILYKTIGCTSIARRRDYAKLTPSEESKFMAMYDALHETFKK